MLTGSSEVPVVSRRDDVRYDSVELADITISYSWCHSRRKTLAITVRPDRSVSVRVPLRTPIKQIKEFVSQRAEWVLKVLKKLDDKPVKQQQDYGRGAIFMYQGEPVLLEFASGPRRSVHLHEGLLILAAPEMLSEEAVRRMIDGWYRKQALTIVKARSIECHRMMQKEGIPLPQIIIRSMKTRWGSYSYRTSRISLNLYLIKTPQVCLDYVIIHELCHIKVRHHGSEFWHMVGRYIPDHVTIRKALKNYI
jgi:hypothetical protein